MTMCRRLVTEGDVTMSVFRSLKTIQLDALRETANIGAGHAATPLSQMTDSTIMIQVPNITVSSMEELPSEFTPEEEPVAAVLMHMLGDLSGRTMRVFPKPTVISSALKVSYSS